jgi:hypothetical protein
MASPVSDQNIKAEEAASAKEKQTREALDSVVCGSWIPHHQHSNQREDHADQFHQQTFQLALINFYDLIVGITLFHNRLFFFDAAKVLQNVGTANE